MLGSGRFLDRQEIRSPADRERALFHALPGLLSHAIENTGYFSKTLKGIAPNDITSREALASLPILRKDALFEAQQATPPFGEINATMTSRLTHVYCSPGPIYDPEGNRSDYWRFARALFAAGFRKGDLVHNSFSYHITPAGLMIDQAARSLGCPVFPAGTGQTEKQIDIMRDLQPAAFVGTPSFLKILCTRAKERGINLDCLRKAVVSGEAFTAASREQLRDEFGIDAFESYGTADVGLIAYESEGRDGLIVEESIILEIVQPGSSKPVAPGEVGEVVVTLFNPDYPLVRFATGDMSKLLEGPSPCGRTNHRIAGWLGRADQRTKVRGMFVDPKQVHDLIALFPDVGKARLEVTNPDDQDEMTLRVELDQGPAADHQDLAEKIAGKAREIFGLRCLVTLDASGNLPNDGKIIDDQRQIS